MNARETERHLIARCIDVANGRDEPPHDQREANVFALASMLIRSTHPRQSQRLVEVADLYFSKNPASRVPAADMVRREWVVGLPRLRDLLGYELKRRGVPKHYPVYTNTPLAKAVLELFRRLEERIELAVPVKVTLAGDAAVHFYTGVRSTTDLDAKFDHKLLLPSDLMVDMVLEDGSTQVVYFNSNYNPTFALMHEDYLEDARPVPELDTDHFKVYVLSPVDLVVSKIARLAENDREDVAALMRLGLTDSASIRQRATEALTGYIGGLRMIKGNIESAVSIAENVEREKSASNDNDSISA